MGVVALCSLLGGCEDVGAVLGDLSEEIRGVEADEGRSGTYRALYVAHAASDVATRMAQTPSEGCALDVPDGGFRYVLELEVEREARAESAVTWTETRTFTVDSDGDMRLEMEASYSDDLGDTGVHKPVRMIVGGQGYEGPDPEHIFRREVSAAERRALVSAGRGTFQALLDAAPGWAWQASDETWELGSESLRCGVEGASSEGWLSRLATRGSMVHASLEAKAGGRVLDLRWLLEDGVVMQVSAADRIVAFEGNIEPPPESHIIDVSRDRSWKTVHELLDRLDEKGAIERDTEDVDAKSD
ncbi:MAG: hypothetical protein ACQEVA_01950 [Myxococcota bacterium]